MTRRHAAHLHAATVPVVLVNATTGGGLAAVTTAHRRGARMAAEHLIGLGHRRIGHISARAEHAASGLRRRGVRDAAADAVIVEGDGGVEGGALAVPLLLGSGATGIVAYNDLTAIGALRGLRQAGALVPDEVSVVGFDDIEMAAWTDPPLTTIRQPTDALGQWAVDRLARVLAGERAATVERVVLVPELVVRGSTAPVRSEPGRGG